MALGALLAVAAGAVEFAEVVDSEVFDCDGAFAVVLDHFVLCGCGAASDNCGELLVTSFFFFLFFFSLLK